MIYNQIRSWSVIFLKNDPQSHHDLIFDCDLIFLQSDHPSSGFFFFFCWLDSCENLGNRYLESHQWQSRLFFSYAAFGLGTSAFRQPLDKATQPLVFGQLGLSWNIAWRDVHEKEGCHLRKVSSYKTASICGSLIW